jgi:hypothetical protein
MKPPDWEVFLFKLATKPTFKMKSFLLYSFALCAFSCHKKENLAEEHLAVQDSVVKPLLPENVTKTDTAYINYDDYAGTPKLVFNTISEDEFNLHYIEFKIDSLPIENDKDHFYINTAKRKQTFLKYADRGAEDGPNGYNYMGYYPRLDLYAITHNYVGDNIDFGDMILLDKETGYTYFLISLAGDWNVSIPIPSPDKKYLLYYQDEGYSDDKSCIAVLKTNSKSNPEKYLEAFRKYDSEKFLVEKAGWDAENNIYVKGYVQILDETKREWHNEYMYYKAKL